MDIGEHSMKLRAVLLAENQFDLTTFYNVSSRILMVKTLCMKHQSNGTLSSIIKNLYIVSKYFEDKNVIIFLSNSFKICFGCSKKSSHWDDSFENPQHMFELRIKITHPYPVVWFNPLLHSYACWCLWITMYLKILWKMEHLLFWSKCSISNNIFKIIQSLMLSKIRKWYHDLKKHME